MFNLFYTDFEWKELIHLCSTNELYQIECFSIRASIVKKFHQVFLLRSIYLSIYIYLYLYIKHTLIKNLPAMQETRVWFPEVPLEKGMAIHSSILAWRIPWTEKPGGLQSVGSQRVGHDWATNTHAHIYSMVLCLLHCSTDTCYMSEWTLCKG